MGIAVLGPLQVDGDGAALAPRDRVVLAVLALRVGEVVTADQLAEAVWGETPPATWHKSLQGIVVRLRKRLGPTAIETVGHGYRLSASPADIDAREFERLVARAREQLSLAEPDRAAYTLGSALELWRGAAAADLEGWEPGRMEADRLSELRREAEELWVDCALRSGRHRDVLAHARQLVEQAPLRERRWELLALAQYRAGQQADALRTLQQLRRMLASELGIDPGPDLVALEQAILRQDPGLVPDITISEPSSTCPYQGLVPYDVADADNYFGRNADIAACRRRLDETGVLAVVGPSGSGKSSLVRAGLAAALRRDGERVVVLTPGRHPMAALWGMRGSLARGAVLVVDQVEEAVTLNQDAAERAQFFGALTRHATGGRLVVAMRADRFGDLAAHADFARLVEQGLYLLTPMSADELRESIEAPARQAGLRLEPGLVELLVAEVEGRPGVLPHLSHALRQTWEHREAGVLTLEGYAATGGIRDAVAQSAERVYVDLPADERSLLRDVMLRLVAAGPDGGPVRSRVPRRQLAMDHAHDRVMERLVAARLVTTDDDVYELAHEALARAWPRLQDWLDEDAEGQRILRHLSVAADTWDAMGRTDDELYRGTRLSQALEWRARARPELTPVETAFLSAADQHARRTEWSAMELARAQARVNRRLRVLLVGTVLLLGVSAITGSLAVRQADRAAEATDVAEARRVAAQAQLTGNVDRALALAAAAAAVDPSTDSRAGLLAALGRSPQLSAVRPMPGTWMAMSPGGRTIATLDADHRVRFVDAQTYEQVGEYDPYPDRAVAGIGGNLAPLDFDSDGTRLAVALLTVDDAVVRILDTAGHAPVPDQPGGQPRGAHPSDVEFSPDERYLAVSVSEFAGRYAGEHAVYVWELARPGRPMLRIEVPSDTFHVEFSPDSRRVHAAPGWNSDARPGTWTWSLRTGELVATSRRGGQALESTPDGRTLGYGVDSTVFLVDEASGRVTRRLGQPQDLVERLAFSRDGSLVAAVADDPAAYVWEVGTGRLLERIALEEAAEAVGFARDGESLLVPSGGRLHVFDLSGRERYVARVRAADADTVTESLRVRYASPYDDVVAVSTYRPDRDVAVLRVADRVTEETLSLLGLGWEGDRSDAHAWSPDGNLMALVDWQDRVRVHRVRTGALVVSRRLPGAGQLAWTDDQSGLFLEGPRGLVLLDPRTLRGLTSPVPIADQVVLAELGPGDDTAVVVSAERDGSPFKGLTAADRWRVVDLVSGNTLLSGDLRVPATSMAVSPDGRRMAVAGSGGVEIVDLRTGSSWMPSAAGSRVESEGRLLTYSPDGGLLASADTAGRVSLWDGLTGELLGTVQPGDGRAAPLFLAEEKLLLQYFDGASYVWDTSQDHAISAACRIVGHGLSRTEWQAAFGDQPYVDVCAGVAAD